MDYVELHARSAFSFLRGASTPEQLAQKAAELQLPALALCDRDGVYGAPRFFATARETGVRRDRNVRAELGARGQALRRAALRGGGEERRCADDVEREPLSPERARHAPSPS